MSYDVDFDHRDWLIEVSGDGERESVQIFNATMEDVKRKFAEMLYCGPYEEALDHEDVGAQIKSLDEKDNWHNGVWHENGEQCWFRICSIDESIGADELDSQEGSSHE
jgi:hypothetical protein